MIFVMWPFLPNSGVDSTIMQGGKIVYKMVLTDEEIAHIQSLLSTVTSQYQSADNDGFLKDAGIIAHKLPERLCMFLNDFKLLEPFPGVCVISGYPIDQAKIGKTPSHWRARAQVSPALEEEILLVLCGSLLGDIFGWSTQQEGFLIHDILPIKGDEATQLSSASEQALVWHTEDAFHPCRGDYLGLMCLRNPYNAATTYASIDMFQLEKEQIKTLFEPHFIIRPDLAHLEHLKKGMANLEKLPESYRELFEYAYQQINEMNTNPQKVAVLFGNPRSPYLRDDPYYMDRDTENEKVDLALKVLNHAIDMHLSDLILQPGDIAFLDNYKVVHGRKSFKAMFDGNDRWLKRVNVTRDLRKSRSARPTVTSRVIF